jgi:hypothetical protein
LSKALTFAISEFVGLLKTLKRSLDDAGPTIRRSSGSYRSKKLGSGHKYRPHPRRSEIDSGFNALGERHWVKDFQWIQPPRSASFTRRQQSGITPRNTLCAVPLAIKRQLHYVDFLRLRRCWQR